MASAVLAAEELALIKANVPDEAPDSHQKVGSFEPAEGVKEVPLDPQGSGEKKMRVSVTLTPK